ncbi:hypothetical protein [Methylophilus sp. TWE2]|uniref:hypothetical protein n=1 Tax=Methylophilus sp. TWE2 TaxID=1662285 RepID=UPI000670E454|nr:hypothetical protein [Methylophilus sp. TWE2]AKR42361.1 hypothetical protein ACJ67_02145 [Methylophilus sp. TWE2]
MLKPEENADQIFEIIKNSIVQSCQNHDWSIARNAVQTFGFAESDVSTTFTYAQRYDLMITPTIYLCLSYRSVDPSGPFQNLPDISKFDLGLSIDGQVVKSYTNEYEER